METPDRFPAIETKIVSTSCLHLKRKASKAPIVVYEVRSERIKIKNQGFKSQACMERTCFCCSIDPPTLSPKVIKSLGSEFCKIQGSLLTDTEMKKKPLSRKAAGPKANQSRKNPQKVINEDSPSKKNRKM
jgi:hypothetical protein